MFLAYGDLAKLFPIMKGIQDHELFFHTVATISDMPQLRGLYIPLNEHSGELEKAIENGAVAALWKEGEEIPRYTPNHFPVFYTNDLLKGLKDMMELYIEKVTKEQDAELDVTKFLFSNEILLNENKLTYDIAVMSEKINELGEQLRDRKEGAK
ncbi:hypothetical protein [Bacillus sp. S/N-304-OC-R1]|uniref:hypothetical protein n=1 Tax=Bacillus sp. S/N-304-OC-R1 TaxID=2758034 RepID=UPI001C8E4541|nr:hypothetical protein [Bacillus sp. S/N-304-OC-R1]MBY0120795.1 hypothetical protein [Bacillus sp. S/N-304-OC-R1]